jgi:hypothetical protein
VGFAKGSSAHARGGRATAGSVRRFRSTTKCSPRTVPTTSKGIVLMLARRRQGNLYHRFYKNKRLNSSSPFEGRENRQIDGGTIRQCLATGRFCQEGSLALFFTGDLRTVNSARAAVGSEARDAGRLQEEKERLTGVRRTILGVDGRKKDRGKDRSVLFCTSDCASNIESVWALARNSRQTEDM